MANTTMNEQNKESSWNYWNSMRKSLSLYIQNGLKSVELLQELCTAKLAIGTGKKGKQQWATYVEKALKGNEGIEYIDTYLEAFEHNGYRVPTAEMLTSVSNPKKVVKEAKIAPKDMKPVAVSISKNLNPNWDYFESVKKVRRLYLKWSKVSSDILRELYIAKQAITKGGTRKSGLPKKGEMSWNRYVEEAFGGMVSKRTIDSHLLAYQQNGCQKPEKLTVSAISDHSKVVVKSATREADGRIKVEVYLPEFDTTYIQRFVA